MTTIEKLQSILDRLTRMQPTPHEVEAWSLLYTECYILKLRSMA
jgi:hypothetical protein